VLTEHIEKKNGEYIGSPGDCSVTYLKFFKDGKMVHGIDYDSNVFIDHKVNELGEFEIGILRDIDYDSVDIYLVGYLPEVFVHVKPSFTDIFLGIPARIKTRLQPYRFKYNMDLRCKTSLYMAFPTALPKKNKRDDYYDVEGRYEFANYKHCGCDV